MCRNIDRSCPAMVPLRYVWLPITWYRVDVSCDTVRLMLTLCSQSPGTVMRQRGPKTTTTTTTRMTRMTKMAVRMVGKMDAKTEVKMTSWMVTSRAHMTAITLGLIQWTRSYARTKAAPGWSVAPPAWPPRPTMRRLPQPTSCILHLKHCRLHPCH